MSESELLRVGTVSVPVVIAVDVDGTLYDGDSVASEAIEALAAARQHGHSVMIVTGRRWESLAEVVPSIVALCDRVVCEEGGVLVDVTTGRVTLLGDPVEAALLAGLEAAGVPALDIGRVAIGAPSSMLALVTEVRDRSGSHRRIITNKGSIGLVPVGCDKGTGLRAAVADLGVQGRPILAIGDAANDLAMFAVATVGVGVANADEAVRTSGVPLTTAAVGAGVAEALRRFLPLPPAR